MRRLRDDPGRFIPFDEYEKHLIRKLLRRVNGMRRKTGEAKLTEADLVRGLIRKSIHDVIGIEH